jgi:uncharacterized protein
MSMRILVDADSCPKVIKEILFRVAYRTKLQIIFVANCWLDLPKSEYIELKKVGSGFDVADDEIIKMSQPGDLIITADIPLAYAVVKKGCLALNPRGKVYSENNIQDALSNRDLLSHLRDTGTITGGPGNLSKSNRQEFANNLDKIISQQ